MGNQNLTKLKHHKAEKNTNTYCNVYKLMRVGSGKNQCAIGPANISLAGVSEIRNSRTPPPRMSMELRLPVRKELTRKTRVEVHISVIHHYESTRRIRIAEDGAVIHAIPSERHHAKFPQVALGARPA